VDFPNPGRGEAGSDYRMHEQGVCFFAVPAYFLRRLSKIKEDNTRYDAENNTEGNFSRMTKRDQDSSSGQKTGTGRE
jgi:hypothetical protein